MSSMEVPVVSRCFGIFPPRLATYLISLGGLALGGLCILAIILYALIEKALLSYFVGKHSYKVDENLKKVSLLILGATSLLLTVGNAMLFLGNVTSSRGAVNAAVWVLFSMCLIMIAMLIGAPVSCFLVASTCIVKKISTTAVVLFGIGIGLFLSLWLYFMIVARNFMNEIL